MTSSSYIDLRSLSLELKVMDFEFISRQLAAPSKFHVLEKNILDYAKYIPTLDLDLTLWSMDPVTNTIWVHITLVKIVCEILAADCPDYKLPGYFFLAQEAASRHGSCIASEKLQPIKMDDDTMRSQAEAAKQQERVRIVKAVLGFERYLANISA